MKTEFNDDLGGPLHIWLQAEFSVMRSQMTELIKNVAIVGVSLKEQTTEVARLDAKFSKHVEDDVEQFEAIQEKLADVRSAIIKRESFWEGPKALLMFVGLAISPIATTVLLVWNPFQHS